MVVEAGAFFIFFFRASQIRKKRSLDRPAEAAVSRTEGVQDGRSVGMTLQCDLLSTLVMSFLLIVFVRSFGGTRQIMSKHSVRSRVL